MTVFSYDKVQKRYLWTSLHGQVIAEGMLAPLYWPLLFLWCGIIIVSLGAYVYFSIAQTDTAFDIKKGERNIKTFTVENALLKVKLGEIISPLHLAEVARERGFVGVENPVYVQRGEGFLSTE